MSLVDQCPVLHDMFRSGCSLDSEGNQVKLNAHINQRFAEALYQTVRESKPQVVVEVGMAYGVSTLAILTALREISHEQKSACRLISIDPFQAQDWGSIGLQNVQRANLQDLHEFVNVLDYLALPKLVGDGLKIDFAYIDGWHTFDHALLNFWYLDKMLSIKGVVGFNDCGFDAVDKAIRFMLTHRKYEELDVGLPPTFSIKREARRILQGKFARKHRILNRDRYFRKMSDWEPSWDFYAAF